MKKNKKKGNRRGKRTRKPPIHRNPASTRVKRVGIFQRFRSLFSKLSYGWQVIVVLSVLVGIASGYLSLQTRVSISVGEQAIVSHPYLPEFVASNDGLLPIFDVLILCRTGPRAFGPEGKEKMIMLTEGVPEGMKNYTDKVDRLGPGEKRSFRCVDVMGSNPYVSGPTELQVLVRYKPLLWTRGEAADFRFIPTRNEKGEFGWKPSPINYK